MRWLIVFFVILFALVQPPPLNAQNGVPTCDLGAALKSINPVIKDKSDLITLSNAVSAANVICNGFSFAGKGQKTIGPVDLPNGTWRGMLYSKDALTVIGTVLSGNCGQRDNDNKVAVNFADTKIGITIFLLKPTDHCKLIFEPSMFIDGDWKLTLEPIG